LIIFLYVESTAIVLERFSIFKIGVVIFLFDTFVFSGDIFKIKIPIEKFDKL